jgi:DNA-binding transcriptional regulator YiaG
VARLPLTEAIPAIQRQLRLTPEEMAAELGTTRPTLSRWQRGKERPQVHIVPKLIAMGRRAGIEITVDSMMREVRRRT